MRYDRRPLRRAVSRPVAPSLAIESLERRQLLSGGAFAGKNFAGKEFRPSSDRKPSIAVAASASRVAKVATSSTNYLVTRKNTATAFATATPQYLSPAQLRRIYGIDSVSFGGITGDGSGQTIAIIDAYDNPSFSSSNTAAYASSDAYYFNNYFGLTQFGAAGSGLPTFTKVNQTGGTSYPAANAGWAGEIALDVEWAHAAAPKANIVLVEATNNANSNLLAAVNYAKTIPGVTAISMSYGGNESSSDVASNANYTTPAGHAGVTFLASTGDSGAPGSSPAFLPNVVAVGGTVVDSVTSGYGYGSESGWSGSGGGISVYESQPTYQSQSGLVSQSTTKRTIPDVSIIGGTGVSVYDSYNNGTATPWYGLAGTSLSCPIWAGLTAIANQGRALEGLSSLAGHTLTLSRSDSLPAATGHVGTCCNNGFSAGAGYDLVTGRGTPIANTLLAALAGGSATGTAFADYNGDGTFNNSDVALAGVTVYVDVNNNGAYDGGLETAVTTAAGGAFTLADVVGGLAIREVLPAGYVSTTGTLAGTTAYGGVSGLSFGNFPITFNAPTGTNNYVVGLDATGTRETIALYQPASGNPIASYSVAKSLLTTLSFTGNTGNDSLTLDLTNGNPLLSGGIAFTGGSQTTADAVGVIAAVGGSSVTFGAGLVAIGGLNLSYGGVESLAFTGKAGNDAVNVTSNTIAFAFGGGGGSDALGIIGGTYAPTADLNGAGSSVTLTRTGGTTTFGTSQHLASLTLAGGAVASFTGGTVLRTAGLSVDTTSGSALNLGTTGLLYDYATSSPTATIAALLASGYAGGAWTGLGIRSSAAANDAAKTHALGFGEASTTLNLSGAATATFLGESVDATTVLVRYTYYGDVNLSGNVDVADLGILATNYGMSNRTWAAGDFNFDGVIDVADLGALATAYGLT